jgi:hypothetical protein
LTSRRLGFGAALTAILFVLGCTGAQGPKGDPGPAGDAGPAGDPGDPGKDGKDGTVPPLTNDVTGTVSDANGPLTDVAVSVSPGTATATTDASGKFTLSALDIGVYDVTFKLAGYVDQTVTVGVNLSGPTTLNVTMAVDTASGGPAVALTNQLSAGYGKSVTVKADVTQGKAPYKYSWAQTSGPAVTISGGSTDTITFTTVAFASAMAPLKLANARFGVMGVSPDEAGNYGFEVTVTDADGRVSKGDVTVNSTRPTSGLRMVPIGIPVWLQGDGALVNANQTTWNWTLDVSGASGSTATISNPTSQFPSFIPDVKGTYKLKETVSNKTTTIYAGTWLGEMTKDYSAPQTNAAACGQCHNDNAAPDVWKLWKTTAHASALQRKIEGAAGPHFTEECISCHTVGYDKSASNGGFDDLEAASGWTYPTTLQAGNWDTLVNNTTLGPLAGIQCESCHGPQNQPSGGPHQSTLGAVSCTKDADCTFAVTGSTSQIGACQIPAGQTTGKCLTDIFARASWSSDVCSSCHQEAPFHYKPGQWWNGKHADLELAYVDATVETRGTTAAHCGRCHTAQGYAQYVGQLIQGYTGNLTSDGKPAGASNAATIASLAKLGLTQATVQSQTCQTCHDPHFNDATAHPYQLRIYDAVAGLPNGMSGLSGLGTGMICATCHNTRNGEHSDFVAAPSGWTAPHAAAQADVVFGFNTYYMPRYTPSAHLAVKDTCVGCHTVATADQQAMKQASNHSFVADKTICAACHSANVDGAAFQAANQVNLDALGAAIATKVLKQINNALQPANGGAYYIRAWDPTSDDYSSLTPPSSTTPTASNIMLQVPPTLIEHYEIHGQLGFKLTMPNAIQIQFVKPDGTADPNALVTSKYLYVQAGNLRNATNPNASIGALLLVDANFYKVLWNYYIIRDDNTLGVHNPNFFNDLIAVTNTKVAALP